MDTLRFQILISGTCKCDFIRKRPLQCDLTEGSQHVDIILDYPGGPQIYHKCP